MLEMLKSIWDMLAALFDSLWSLIQWIPFLVRFMNPTSGLMMYVPTLLMPVAIVCGAIYILKFVLGGDNS